MAKQVFNTLMLIHVWANQSQQSGRRASGTLSFEGRLLTHYNGICAVHLDDTILLDPSQCKHTGWNSGDLSWNIQRSAHPRKVLHVTGLRHIARDLAWLVAAQNSKENKNPEYRLHTKELIKRYRADMVKHVAKNSDMSSDGALYLLTLAKVRNPDNAMRKFITDAAKAAAKEQAESAKNKHKKALAFAHNIAAWPLDDCHTKSRELLDRRYGGIEIPLLFCDSRSVYESGLNDSLVQSHKAAKAAKRDKLAAKVWQRLKAWRFEKAAHAKRNARKESNKRLAGLINNYRKGPVAPPYGGKLVTSNHYMQSSLWAVELAGCKRLSDSTSNKIKAQAETWRDESKRLAIEENKAKFEAEKERREKWLAGDTGVHGYGIRDESGGPLLRAVKVERDDSGAIVAGELQTSQGANVPLVHAIKVFQFVKLCKTQNRNWQKNGHAVRVGHFQIDSIDSSGDFVAGCHTIKWPEIERIALQLGVFQLEASDAAKVSTGAH